MEMLSPKSQWNGLCRQQVPADPAEKPFQNRFALLAPRGRQGVECEDQFLGPAQGLADGRTDGV